MGNKTNNDLGLTHQQTETQKKPRNDLQFLGQHVVPNVPGSNPRSKSHFINNFNKSSVGARATSGGNHAGMLRMRKHLYDQNR